MQPFDAREGLRRALRETTLGRVARSFRDGFEGARSVVAAPSLRRARRGAAVIVYHGVVPRLVDPLVEGAHIPASLFRRQVRHLKAHYRIVALAELVGRLAGGAEIPDDWAVISFDDGYRNNLECAHQILREEGNLPMSVFVATDFIGTRRTMDTIAIMMGVLCSGIERLRVPCADGSWRRVALRSRRDRANAYWEMLPRLKALSGERRRELAEEILSQFAEGEIEEIRARFPSYDWLDWEQLAELHREGVDVGSHTCSHARLAGALGETAMRDEITRSRERLADALGAPPRHFAYPYGERDDVSDLAVRLVREGGYACALTASSGTVTRGQDVFRLRRLSGCIQTMPRFRIANASGR